MLKLFKYFKPYIWGLMLLVVLVFIQALANLQLPDYMAKIVNQGIVLQNKDLILQTGLAMLGISLLGGIATVGVGFFASRIATGFAKDIRAKAFAKVEAFSLREIDTFSTASLITRTTNDIQQIQMVLVMVLRLVIMAPILGIGAIIKAYSMAPSISWVITLPVIMIFGLMTVLFTVALPKFKIVQKLVDKLNLVTRENLTGLRVIRAFNREGFEEGKFEQANRDLTDVNLFVNRVMSLMQPMLLLIFNLTAVAIIWFGAHEIQAGNLMVGDMLAFMQYALQVIMSFLFISMMFIMVPRAVVSARRVSEIINTKLSVIDPEKPVLFPQDSHGNIEFRDVTFAYPASEIPVLKHISFTAKRGETTAIIGSTGSGKSTLVNLIPRLYDVTGGAIFIDGVDIRTVKQADLHDKIGYVPQKGVLFSGSVKSNITYGKPEASEEAVKNAAGIAQAEEFIKELENTYDAPISQGGSNVSGGQKQRLSIARAIVKKPEIYIFDDSFSALDFKTDAALRKALVHETKDSSVIIVTQRISSVLHADSIIVLDEGKIAGIGKHEELLASSRVYKEIALSQLSEEELHKSGLHDTDIK